MIDNLKFTVHYSLCIVICVQILSHRPLIILILSNCDPAVPPLYSEMILRLDHRAQGVLFLHSHSTSRELQSRVASYEYMHSLSCERGKHAANAILTFRHKYNDVHFQAMRREIAAGYFINLCHEYTVHSAFNFTLNLGSRVTPATSC